MHFWLGEVRERWYIQVYEKQRRRSSDKFRLGCAKLPWGHPVPIGCTYGNIQMYNRKLYTLSVAHERDIEFGSPR